MILYKHEINFKEGLITKKYEAEEKPKTYFFINSRGWQNRVLKTDIGKLTGVYDKYMYTLSKVSLIDGHDDEPNRYTVRGLPDKTILYYRL